LTSPRAHRFSYVAGSRSVSTALPIVARKFGASLGLELIDDDVLDIAPRLHWVSR